MTTYTRSNLPPSRRQNIDAQQRRLADHERKPWQQTEPHLPDSRYKHIKPREIENKLHFMKTDPTMRLGKETNLNHLLAGGATASVAGIEMDPAWVRKTIETAYVLEAAVGWASFTWLPDSSSPGGKRIVMIDPTQFDVYTRVNKLTEPDCIYVSRGIGDSSSGLLGLGMGIGLGPGAQSFIQVLGGQVLPNVWTIWRDNPTADGDLTSVAASVMPAHEEFIRAQHRAALAEDGRACPPLVTEYKDQHRYNLTEDLASGKVSGPSSMPSTAKSFSQFDKLQQYLANKERSLGTAAYENIVAAMHDMRSEQLDNSQRPMVNLEDDRTLVQSQLPEAPADMHQREIMLQQTKLMAMNVPPALIQTESSRSSRIGVDQSALGIFQQSQLHLRSHFSEVIEFMVGTVFAAEAVAGMLSGVPLHAKVPPIEEVKKAVKPKVSIPGQPPPEVLRQLYMDGVLKYKALRQHYSGLFSIPLSDLHEEPAITLEDVLTGGKLKIENAKSKTTKEGNESKERQLAQQTKLQETRNKGAAEKAKAAAAKPKAKAKSKPASSSGGGGS